jgi:hypothetical protein
MMILFSILVGIFFFFLFSLETIGYSLKDIGGRYNLPSLGYSIHVQVATFARAFSLFAFPLVGFMLDSSVGVRDMTIIPLLSSSLFIALFFIVHRKNDFFLLHIDSLFLTYVKKAYGLGNLKCSKQRDPVNQDEYFGIFVASGLAFFITVFGIFFTLILASIYHDYRATILQSSAVVTSAGTLLSVFYLDPKLSKLVDAKLEFSPILKIIYLSRLFSMTLIFIMAVIVFYIY